jgi:hypothetical protein
MQGLAAVQTLYAAEAEGVIGVPEVFATHSCPCDRCRLEIQGR